MNNNIKEVTQDNFQKEVIEFEGRVLVDFYADWCGPCKALAPELGIIAAKYEGDTKIKIVKLDTEANYDLSMKYRISSIPNCIVFENGVVKDQIIGLRQGKVYEDALTK
jgi:thioredoxin 1